MIDLLLIGVNHETAPAAVRDAVAMEREEAERFLATVRDTSGAVAETNVLSTCHRTELYAAGEGVATAGRELGAALDAFRGVTLFGGGEHTYLYRGHAVARHLFRVAAGLDSLMLGEHQVLGQVKEAAELGEQCGSAGPMLSRLFHAAATAGSRVRNETAIAKGAVSVALAAVRMAAKVFGDLSRSRVLVIGAGETGALVARHFAKERPVELVVANRTQERAAALAQSLGGRPWPLDRLEEAVQKADVLVSATSAPGHVLPLALLERVMRSRGGRPLVIVDIANPRDVAPAAARLSNVFLYDLDSLESIVQQHRAARAREVPKAERIVDDELDHYLEWYNVMQVKPMIRALRLSFEEIGEREARRHAKHFSATEHEALARYTRSLINKLLHHPTLRIKTVDRSSGDGMAMLAAVQDLFQLPPSMGPSRHQADAE